MRRPSESEILSLRELLQMEVNGLATVKVAQMVATDKEVKAQVDSAVLAAEERIKGIQQFITENEILPSGEVQ